MLTKRLVIKFLFFVLSCKSIAFANTLDSLNTVLAATKNSTEKIATLNQISWQYLLISDYDNAIITAQKAVDINKIEDKELALSYNYIAYSYNGKGNYEKALEYHLKALKIRETIKADVAIIASLNGIGTVYYNLGNYAKSLEYYEKSLVLAEKTKDRSSISTALTTIGNLYYSNREDAKARSFYEKALKLEQENHNPENIALLLSNIGNIYFDIPDYNKALGYYRQSIEIRERISDNNGLTECYYNVALVYTQQKEFKKAKEYFTKTIELARKIGANESLMNCYLGFSEAYEAEGDKAQALICYKKYASLKDSILNIESAENINKLNTLYESEKKNKTIELLNKDKEKQILLNEEETKKRRIMILSFSFVMGLILVFALFIYKSLKRKQRDNIEITKQKELVQHKNKEITDSINYALRIQNSFLASKKLFEENFKDHFILFKPKDIVSGDFYWAENKDGNFYLCAADSTGHGIPGAFMSLLNISLLNESLFSKNLSSTAEILNFVRSILIKGLKADLSGQGGNDGMDCALISLSLKNMELEFSGANNPLWIKRGMEMIELDPNKMPVGRSPRQEETFSSTKIKLISGDVIYLFTDGYADQFGGPTAALGGKKFKYKPLKELLIAISTLPMEEQKNILDKAFEDWKGNLEQVDDVCIVGIQV